MKKSFMVKMLSVLILSLVCIFSYAGVVLVENGKSNTEIVTGKNPSFVVRFAAEELAAFLGRAGKCKIAVKESSNAPVRIYLGATAEAQKAGYAPKDNDHIISIRKDGSIFLLGKDDSGKAKKPIYDLMLNTADRGTLETVYTFLEKYIGVRWLEPGKDGEYVPQLAKIELQPVEENIIPVFSERRTYHFQSLWAAYSKYSAPPVDLKEFGSYNDVWLWGLRMRYTNQRYAPVNGCHTPAYLWMDKKLYPKHPEWFALQKDGSRSSNDLCWSNPAVEDFWYRAVDAFFRGDPNPKAVGIDADGWNVHMFSNRDEFMIDPHDYVNYFCCCKNCEEYRKPYGKNGQGELVYKVIFNVAEKIYKKYPNKRITTLVYPPKRFFPKDKKIPPNVRVRITYPWTAIDPDSQGRKDALELTRQWNKGANQKAYLWLYLISTFGYSNYGVPEATAYQMQKLLQDVQPDTVGIFYEHSEPSQTIRNIDQYMIGHLCWDPHLDLDKMMDEYFKLAFGKASSDMRNFYAELEKKWLNVAKMYVAKKVEQGHLRTIFDTEYKYTELVRLDKMLSSALAKVPQNSPGAKRIKRFQKYVMDIAKNEFSIHSSDKVNSFKTAEIIPVGVVKKAPAEADWANVPYLNMVSARGDKLTRKSKFKILVSDDTFYLRGKFDEPAMANSSTDPNRKQGNWQDIWLDNVVELFFADDNDKITQVLVNDRGIYAVNYIKDNKWVTDAAGVKCTAKRTSEGFELDIAVPHAVSRLNMNSKNPRFNITRTVHVKNAAREFSTFSKDCQVGRWTMAKCYAVLQKTVLKDVKPYEGVARPVSNLPAVDFASGIKTAHRNQWAFWAPPRGHSEVYQDHKNPGRSKYHSYVIKYKPGVKVDEKKFASSCRYWGKVPPYGSTVRVTAWYRAETLNPNCQLMMKVDWLNAKRTWYKGTVHSYSGRAFVKAVSNEWQKIEMEIPVPKIPEIHYISVSFSPVDLRPGSVYIDDLKIEIVK